MMAQVGEGARAGAKDVPSPADEAVLQARGVT